MMFVIVRNDPIAEPAEPRQVLRRTTGHHARAFDVIEADLDKLDEAADFSRVHAAICIQRDDNVTLGAEEALAQSVSLASPCLMDNSDLGQFPLCDGHSLIDGEPIDENHLVDPGGIFSRTKGSASASLRAGITTETRSLTRCPPAGLPNDGHGRRRKFGMIPVCTDPALF